MEKKIILLLITILLIGCKITNHYGEKDCPMIGISYQDYENNTTILREWIVVDWCKLNTKTGRGRWHYTETVIHGQDPIIPAKIKRKFNL